MRKRNGQLADSKEEMDDAYVQVLPDSESIVMVHLTVLEQSLRCLVARDSDRMKV